MSTTTYEEARKCPRCKQFGEEQSSHPGDRGSTVHVFMCVTEGCRWYQTSWLVQVNRDGSIPIREKGEKDFEPLKEHQKQAMRDRLAQHKEMERRGVIDPRIR